MKYLWCILAVCFIAVISTEALDLEALGNVVHTYKQLHRDPNDMGQMINCGKSEGGSDFKLTWSPAAIAPEKEYKISMSGKASVDFTSGWANVTVWIKGYGPPVYSNKQAVTCAEALPFTKGLLKCPVKTGATLNVPSYSITAPKKVSSVPPGTYTVQLRLTNEKGQLFVCAKGDITVSG